MNNKCRMKEYPYPDECIYILFASTHSMVSVSKEDILAGKALLRELEAAVNASHTEYYSVVARSLDYAIEEVNRFLTEGEKVRSAFSLDEVKEILAAFDSEEKIKVLSVEDISESAYKRFIYKSNQEEDQDYLFIMGGSLEEVGAFLIGRGYSDGELLSEEDVVRLKDKMQQVQWGKSQHLYHYSEEEQEEDASSENLKEIF